MLLDKNTLPQVAMEFMNDTHNEDVDIINELFELILFYEKNATEENSQALNEKYQEWFTHTIAHFQTEEKKMQEMMFPPYPMHKGEHDKALHKMDEIFREWKKSSNISVLKNYMQGELPNWLVHHIQTMDTVTAMFFKSGVSPCSLH